MDRDHAILVIKHSGNKNIKTYIFPGGWPKAHPEGSRKLSSSAHDYMVSHYECVSMRV